VTCEGNMGHVFVCARRRGGQDKKGEGISTEGVGEGVENDMGC
jgi:hypothetical protein